MPRLAGFWLVYARYAPHGDGCVLHVHCDTREQLNAVLSMLRTVPSDSEMLDDCICFVSDEEIFVRPDPNFPRRDVMTHADFMRRW